MPAIDFKFGMLSDWNPTEWHGNNMQIRCTAFAFLSLYLSQYHLGVEAHFGVYPAKYSSESNMSTKYKFIVHYTIFS
jgi:hypothetical protein